MSSKTNTKDVLIEDKLKELFDLQQIDSQIDQFAILKGELPMEVSDLEDEIVGLETRINKLATNVSDLEGDMTRHRANIKEAEALIERYEKQMDNVKNNREYDALSKELELQRLEIQLSEKKMKEVGGYVGAKQETLKIAQDRLASKQEELKIKKVELEQIIEKTDKEEQKLMKKSEKTKKKIEERLLKAYTKIRGAYRNGLAVVTVERDSCGGCFNKIPPQIQLEINMMKKVIACEHCGRVIVDDSIAGIIRPIEVEPAKKKTTRRKKATTK